MNRSVALCAAAIFFAGFALAAQDAVAPDAMDEYLRNLAGPGAQECPRAEFGVDYKTPNDCALAASAAKKPFYLRYEMETRDGHEIAIGMVGAADGKSYMVGYNSIGIKQHPAKSTFTQMELQMISMAGSKHPFQAKADTQPGECLACHQDKVADERFIQSACSGPLYTDSKSGRIVCSNAPPWGIKPGCGGSCHKGQVQQQ